MSCRVVVFGMSIALAVIAGANHDETSAFLTISDAPGAFAAYLAAIGQSSRATTLLALYPPSQLGERGAAIAYSTDVAFACPALALASVRPGSSRLYELDRPVSSGPNVGLGAVHGLDFLYLFGTFAAWGMARLATWLTVLTDDAHRFIANRITDRL